MPSKLLSAAAAALAATLVSAQTSTDCNPLQKTCPADPALAANVTCDLTQGLCKDIFKNLDGTQATYDPSLGGVFAIKGYSDAPTFQSLNYIFFGRVDVTVQAAPGAGIVTSFVLQSDDLDEIDIEWVGADQQHVQTNYFSKGFTGTYDRGATYAVSNAMTQFHTYSLIWTQDSLQWLIDGAVIRTLTAADAEGGPSGYPQTPMQVKLGTWVAGAPGAPDGTVTWAGGMASFPGTYTAYYKSIVISDYEGGQTGAKQYIYGDHSGTWQSIEVDKTGGSNSTSTSAAPTTMSTAASNATATQSGGAGATGTGSTTGGAKTSQTAAPNAASPVKVTGFRTVALAGAALVLANLIL